MPETTGQKLRRLRGDRTLAEVSKATGVPISTISMLERDIRGARYATMQKLADYYGRTVAYIFFKPGTRKMRA